MKKRTMNVLAALSLVGLFAIPSQATEVAVINRFDVCMSEAEYQELLSQGWTESDIDYMSQEDVNKFLSQSGGEVVAVTEDYFICKTDGSSIQATEEEARKYAELLNAGIMPLEDETSSASDNDGVCRTLDHV